MVWMQMVRLCIKPSIILVPLIEFVYEVSLVPPSLQCMPERSQIVACWSEKGAIDIYDITNQLNILNGIYTLLRRFNLIGTQGIRNPSQASVYSYIHPCEGYATDWSRCSQGTYVLKGEMMSQSGHW